MCYAMSRTIRYLLIILPGLSLIACAGQGDRVSNQELDDGQFVGMLHHSVPGECLSHDGCGPTFSLLDETLSRFTPLYGEADPKHDGLVIMADGDITRINKADARSLGDAAAARAIKMKRYRLLSKIPYHDFLVQQAGEYTINTYGCDLLWDKTFSWRYEDKQVHLQVRMTDTFSTMQPNPYVELSFDGTTGDLIGSALSPSDANPCTGR
ncbi:MAG: hypothetical protein DHS20C01_05430 [marine bacterium B5-7]|nr:MAG: hypothetical protein DHS20C01_05430 [marine bacterium B5-7]